MTSPAATAGVILSEHPPGSHHWWVWCPGDHEWKYLVQADPEDKKVRLWVRFLQFHRENPHVYVRLKVMAEQLREKGWRHYSMRTLLAVLRFESDLDTSSDEVPLDTDPPERRRLRLNNDYSPYYARVLALEDRRFRDFFEMRVTKDRKNGGAS